MWENRGEQNQMEISVNFLGFIGIDKNLTETHRRLLLLFPLRLVRNFFILSTIDTKYFRMLSI